MITFGMLHDQAMSDQGPDTTGIRTEAYYSGRVDNSGGYEPPVLYATNKARVGT